MDDRLTWVGVNTPPFVTAAVIGCGAVGPNHGAGLALDDRVRLKWACDLDPRRLGRVTAERHCEDWQVIADDPEVDLVCLCTPHHAHADLACRLLAAGKHLLCEKPLAITPDEVRRMVAAAEAAERQGLVASGIFQHRFDPLVRRLRELAASGAFGRFLHGRMRFTCTRTADYYASDPWRGTWAGEGGGLMINQAIHTLDSALHLAGKPASVRGTVARVRLDCIEVEDQAEGVVRMADGGELTFSCANLADAGWQALIELEWEDASLVLGQNERLTSFRHGNAALRAEIEALGRVGITGISMPGKPVYGDQHALQIADVLAAVRRGSRPYVTLAEAATTPLAVLALYHSAATGGEAMIADLDASYRQPTLLRSSTGVSA